MSHLIIEQGKDVGREVTVPAAGMKFGKSPANDLVLDDERIMLFHGRFFFKSDHSLWITDFSAAEKTTVGGEPIVEQKLKIGDLVEVGGTAFRVIATTQEEASSQEAETPAKSDEGIDLGFKKTTKGAEAKVKKERSRTQSFLHRVLQVVIVLLLVLLVAIAVPEIRRLTESSVKPASEQDKSLSFTYECVRGNYKDIFRYYLELTPDGKASILIDNLGSRHIAESADVSEEALETLSRRLASSGFFDIERDYVLNAPNMYESYDIAIYLDGKFNQVRVLNKEMPKDLEHTISILEDFVFNELNVPFTLLEDEETLLRLAAESFKLGEARFSERDVRPGNLALAVKHYREALVYLETLEPRPELYGRVKLGMSKAESEQDERYKDYKFNAERAKRLGDWREADKYLRILAELIPDRDDPRYETISTMQLEVEENLR